MKIEVAGATLDLLAERAVYWPGRATLLVADAHFGKAAAFRAHAVYVPEATTGAALARLDAMLAATRAERLIFLGDLLHAREGVKPDVVAAIAKWRESHKRVAMLLVRGNHDQRAGDPPVELGIQCHDAPLLEAPFAFVHLPCDVPGHYAIAGHIHPAAVLRGPAHQRECLPCFWFGERCAVLPAFGEFTGLAEVEPARTDRVFVITDAGVAAASIGGTFVPRPVGAAYIDLSPK
jgi:DNA ligase-associated metallophosphoesterase